MTLACLTQELYCLTIFLYHNLKVVKVVIIHQTIMQAQQIQQRMRESLLMEPLHPQNLPITAIPLITQRDLKVAAAGQLPSTGPASTRPGCQTVHACHFPSTIARTHSRFQLDQDPYFPTLPLTDRMHSPPLRRRSYRTFFATPTGNLTRARRPLWTIHRTIAD